MMHRRFATSASNRRSVSVWPALSACTGLVTLLSVMPGCADLQFASSAEPRDVAVIRTPSNHADDLFAENLVRVSHHTSSSSDDPGYAVWISLPLAGPFAPAHVRTGLRDLDELLAVLDGARVSHWVGPAEAFELAVQPISKPGWAILLLDPSPDPRHAQRQVSAEMIQLAEHLDARQIPYAWWTESPATTSDGLLASDVAQPTPTTDPVLFY